MPNVNNGYRLNMTYDGSNVLLNPKKEGIDESTSTTTDNVLDLSNKQNLLAELTTQDLSTVKAIKIGSKYIMAPDQATLKGLVDQLKNVCISDDGTLRRDYQRVVLERKTHAAHDNQPATTQVSLNVIGPEPNDGFEDTHDYIKTVHILQPKDTLLELAKQYYGEANLARNAQLLANFNELSDPNRIQAGNPLYIPELEVLQLYKDPPKPPVVANPQPVTGGNQVPGGNNQVTPPADPVTPPPVTPVTPPADPAVDPAAPAAGSPTETYNGPMTAEGLMNFIGQDGLDFLITAEGARNKAYKDSVGKWTTGVGHLIRLPAERNLLTKTLTQDEMRQLLMKDLGHHIQPLLDNLNPDVLRQLNRNQITALASLAFNIGPGGIVKGHKRGFKYSPVVAALNRPGDFNQNLIAAATALNRHTYAGGHRSSSLANRRESERLLMLAPTLKAGDMPVYDVRALRQIARQQGIAP